ncbi:GntR family transcriptional regulator [Sulfitobacter sp. D35]|uniref:GntR family transcriptional regulator n=1 Tax=Sulfitobacter sp. D35 TaxID=3083252 RepID=UPI00296F94C6|nr:GntR family transcriptional regulator [Sulfitobacter sp. D35]MDW4498781.1 GntR family transcriptional regulator [Sulfitobacter sp. D35]
MPQKILADQIANELRRDILRGKLPPGTFVKERDNAAELGVSRTPMREAIRILAKEGLLQLRASRSPVVTQLDAREAADQTAVLIALEKLSAELACEHATDADIDGLQAMVDEMARRFDRADPVDIFEIDMGFHTAIAAASHNASLAETHRSFLERLWRARYLAAVQRRNRERLVSQHRDIVEALRRRDPEAVRGAIEIHLRDLAADIRRVIERETHSGGVNGRNGRES